VGLGGFAGEIGVGGWHGRAPVPPLGGYHVSGGLVEVAGGCIRLGAGSGMSPAIDVGLSMRPGLGVGGFGRVVGAGREAGPGG
jgi:hypothetical protein